MDCVTLVIVDLWNNSSILSSNLSLRYASWEYYQIPRLLIVCQVVSSILQLCYNRAVSWIPPTK